MEKERLRVSNIQTYQGFPSISYVVSEFFRKVTKVGMEAAVLVNLEIEILVKDSVDSDERTNLPVNQNLVPCGVFFFYYLQGMFYINLQEIVEKSGQWAVLRSDIQYPALLSSVDRFKNKVLVPIFWIETIGAAAIASGVITKYPNYSAL